MVHFLRVKFPKTYSEKDWSIQWWICLLRDFCNILLFVLSGWCSGGGHGGISRHDVLWSRKTILSLWWWDDKALNFMILKWVRPKTIAEFDAFRDSLRKNRLWSQPVKVLEYCWSIEFWVNYIYLCSCVSVGRVTCVPASSSFCITSKSWKELQWGEVATVLTTHHWLPIPNIAFTPVASDDCFARNLFLKQGQSGMTDKGMNQIFNAFFQCFLPIIQI